jgi:hypothetical protein
MKMQKGIFFLLFVCFLQCSCSNQAKQNKIDSAEIKRKIGGHLSIFINGKNEILIAPEEDSVLVRRKIEYEEFDTSGNRNYQMTTTESVKSKPISDSLYQLVFDLLAKPDFFKTDTTNKGTEDDLVVSFGKGNAWFSSKFVRIDNWKTATPQTTNLYWFLKRNKMIE